MSKTRDSQLAQKHKTAKPATKQGAPTPNRGAQALAGSPAQLLQLQRQYGNQAVQQTIQREADMGRASEQRLGQSTIQRVGINDQATYAQPNDVMGASGDLKKTEETPEVELRAQVKQLIDHAVLASTDFKALINGVVGFVNGQIPGGCVNGDPGFAHVTKGLQGAIEKAQGRMEGETVGQMKDVLRGTLKCKNVQAFSKAQEFLEARAAKLMALTEIKAGGTQKKDMFQPDKRKKEGAGDMVGYGDIKYITPVIHWLFNKPSAGVPSVRADFWMYAEIQLMTDEMNTKKMEAGGHTFYDLTREVKKPDTATGDTSYRIAPKDSTAHAVHDLLTIHLAALKRGVNAAPLATLLPKLRQLQQGQPIELTKAEYDGLVLAGELVYRKERVEGNIERQGMGAGSWTV